MGSGELSIRSGVLRVVLVLGLAQLLSFARTVRAQTADLPFCDKFALPYGFDCWEYTAITTDGFLLAAHRVSHRPRTTSKSQSRTSRAGEVSAPLPPLCVRTEGQPFESIPDFLRDSDHEPRSSSGAAVDCVPPLQAPTQALSGGKLSAHGSAEDGLDVEEQGTDHTISDRTFRPSADSDLGYRRGQSEIDPAESLSVELSSPDGGTARQTAGSSDEVERDDPEAEDSQAPSPSHGGTPRQSADASDEVGRGDPEAEDSQAPTPSRTHGAIREPVLLMHHEFQNGDSWFRRTHGDSDQLLPFLLLNAGFDVWVGHLRATFYAHEHVTLTPESQSFWNWTWDDHAAYDMPALLQLVESETGSAVHFVGISQSATAGAAAATMPLVSPLLKSLTLVGPTIYRGNTTSRLLNSWETLVASSIARGRPSTQFRLHFIRADHVQNHRACMYTLHQTYSHGEFQRGVFNLTTEPFSVLSRVVPVPALVTDVSGPNCCLGSEFEVRFGNGWDSATSVKNVMHYQQGIQTNTWRRFDYGSVTNNSLAYNGSPVPPIYDPEGIPATVPVLVIYGGRDNMAPPTGISRFLSELRSRPSSGDAAVFLPAYAHFDLLYSVDRTQDVFVPVLQFLERQRALQ